MDDIRCMKNGRLLTYANVVKMNSKDGDGGAGNETGSLWPSGWDEETPTSQTTETQCSDRGDDVQSPMQRFLQNARSPDKCNRQMVGRSALETLRLVMCSPSDAATVLDVVSTVAGDNETSVRCEIMEFVPHMALLLSEDSSEPVLRALITSHLVPAVTKVLADPDQQVLKMAENALLTMLEHCLVTGDYVEKKVWPVIKGRLQSDPTVEGTIGVITIMSKMAPWVGSEVTQRLFVPLLVHFSGSSEFFVRRVCASIFGELCAVVGTEKTETILLHSFLRLCSDEVWGVRKTCAESFMSMSCAVSLPIRKSALAPAFAGLLTDKMRWVQLAAFQSLGPFITTFAQPSVTALAYNTQGELVLKHPHGFEFKLHSTKLEDRYNPLYFAMILEEGNTESASILQDLGLNNNTDSTNFTSNIKNTNHSSSSEVSRTPVEEKSREKCEVQNQEDAERYNQFNFWREPVLTVDLNGEIVTEIKTIQSPEKEKSKSDIEPLVNVLKELGIWKDPQQAKQSSKDTMKSATEEIKSTQIGKKQQDIVPEELIRHFVSMSDPKQDRSSDLAHHCAYNLPAVALTLGPDNWTLLKDAYETLAADRQWKVRRIVASSIHELAVIVGEEVATQDLVPIFNGFIKDLDEVRIGALKHLAHFLKLLRPAGRNSFLPRLAEFLMTDYDWNWRFREELGAQLVQALGLFTPSDTCHHLTPVAISLLLDKVAQVRKVALHLVTELVNHVSIDVGLLRGLLAELAAQFAHSSRWNRRQTFALLCARLLSERVLSEEMFERDVLPHLLDLSWDRVPNVRLAVARVLASHAMTNPYFADPLSPHHEVLMTVMKRLQGDKDRDVRYFATVPPKDSSLNTQIQDEATTKPESTEWLRRT